MNAVLEKFAHNPIIDEIVYWPPREKRLTRIERDVPTTGSCFVTLFFDDMTTEVVVIGRGCFESHWNEAVAVLTAVLNVAGDLAPLSVAETESLERARQEFQASQRELVSRDSLRIKQQMIRLIEGVNVQISSFSFLLWEKPRSAPCRTRWFLLGSIAVVTTSTW